MSVLAALKSRRRELATDQNAITPDELWSAHRHLKSFGYVGSDVVEEATVWPGVQSYRHFRGLPSPAAVHAPTLRQTLDIMGQPRCGLADLPSANPTRTRRWRFAATIGDAIAPGTLVLRYRFLRELSTTNVGGDGEWDAVRRALDTWEAAVEVRFVEAAATEEPDFVVLWAAKTTELASVLASADLPTPIVPSAPRQLRFFNDHTWTTDAPSPGRFDVESIALHEIGHILGLGHDDGGSCDAAVMCPSFTSQPKRQLRQRDIDAFITI